MSQPDMNNLGWEQAKDSTVYIVSTQPHLLDLAFINAAFASEEMYWAQPLPTDQLATMLSQSITLGLYERVPSIPPAATVDEPASPRTPSPSLEGPHQEGLKQIGLARFITDHVSTAYLTDVYVLPDYRQYGLGKWLISCCNDVLKTLPAMRRALLVASPGVGKEFYTRELGMWDTAEESKHMVIMTRKAYGDHHAQ